VQAVLGLDEPATLKITGFLYVVGYLALPIGIVASQLLGLQPDFEES